jgi:3-isopropylmalate dehydratase small subunit
MTLPEKISGQVLKLGDNVNTDTLHPSTYFSLNAVRVREGILEGMDRLGTGTKMDSPAEGLIIVAGKNFGCGSSRETSVRGLRDFGIKAVVAISFARIFYRSLTNLGIPAFECGEIQKGVKEGDAIDIFVRERKIDLPDGRSFIFSPIDPHIMKILESGGLTPYLQRERT